MRVCEKKSEKWMGKWNLVPGVESSTDHPQVALGSLRRPQTSHARSPTMRQLSHICDWFHPDHVGDIQTGSQTGLRLPQASWD